METSFKRQCLGLRSKGYTLLEIAKVTGRPKTSVYFHIRDIPLDPLRLDAHRKASGERIKKFSVARRGKSDREFTPLSSWTPENVLLLSHLIFDGEILRSKCAYNNRSTTLLQRVESLMKQLYSYPAKRYKNSQTGVTRLMYFNVALSAHLRERADMLMREIPLMGTEFKREFLRAFFDDEGCVTFNQSKKRLVRGYQKDTKILSLVQKLLSDLHIRSLVVLPNEVVVSGKDNLKKFQKEINFSPGVRINGKRSNSLWKKSIEKRVLLDRAIKSFKK